MPFFVENCEEEEEEEDGVIDLHCCFSGEQSGPLVVKSDGG